MKRYKILFFCTALIPALLLFWRLWKYDFGLVDDAYIPMTYARNIAQGHGIVFYPGGERIEGYTSPSWVGWLTLAALGGASLPWASQVTSLIFALFLIFLSVVVYRNFYHSAKDETNFMGLFWPLAAGIAVVSDVSLAAYSVSGMEATAYSFLLLWLAYELIRRQSDVKVCLLMLIASLTRPESPAFWLLCLGYWLAAKRLSKSRLILFIVSVIVPFCLFIGFRVFYFGQLLPNTFYAKHNFGGLDLIWRGWEYTYHFFRPRPLFLFAVIGLLLEKKEMRMPSIWIFLFGLLHVFLVTLEGGDHFTLHRFMIPAVAFFSILSVRGIYLCAERLLEERRKKMQGLPRMIMNGAAALFVLIMIPAHGAQLRDYSVDTPCHFAQGLNYHLSVVKWTRSWVKVGQWLKEKYPPDALIAVINAGAIPYACELRCLDMLGLNDSVIAHTPVQYENLCLPGHDKSNSGYVLEQKPQLIQLFPLLFFSSKPYPENELEDMITYPAQIDMWQEKRFHEEYEYRTEETRFGFISYFERRDNVDG
ncbi:MAG: hypothetical protein JXR73_19595 [Candidatus Omnitrophica bacterium]|nr:hypothetical protein [Candidatus Omnitrophota bacterium]